MADISMTPSGRGNTDVPHQTPLTPGEDARSVLINRISWGAVFAGVAVALVTQVLLNMLGVSLGAATIDPASGETPAASSMTIGAALWWSISGIIAAFLGGLTAGRLAGRPKETTSAWHGLVAWAATTIFVLYFATTAVGSIVGGAFSTLGNALSGTAQTAVQAAAPIVRQVEDPFASIESQVRAATGGDPQAAQDAAVAAVRALVMGDEQAAEQARNRAVQALAQAQGIPEEEARGRIQQYEQRYKQIVDQATQQAKQAADATANAVSSAAFWGFIALALGAVAGWFGGRMGTVAPTETVSQRSY